MLYANRVPLALAVTSAVILGVAALSARTQTTPAAITILNRMNSAYRSVRSFRDVATIKRVIGKQETSATMTILAQRPNHFLLELKGDKLNTFVVSDGSALIAMRTDRKVYTKAKAPQLLMGSDVLAGVELPSPGPRIIAMMLAANAREGDVAKMLTSAKVEGPQRVGERTAYVLTFPYGDDADVKLTVGADDYYLREVQVTRNGAVDWTETHDNIQTDKPIPNSDFSRPLPEGAVLVTALPALEKPVPAEDAESVEDLAKDPARLEKAAVAIYKAAKCGGCHDNGTGPDLTQEGADQSHTVKWISDQIKIPQMHTPGSSMPAFKGKISDRNIEILATYLTHLK